MSSQSDSESDFEYNDRNKGLSYTKKTGTDEWVVWKFGGTSVGSANTIKVCIDLVRRFFSEYCDSKLVIVISAMAQVTNCLQSLCRKVPNSNNRGNITENSSNLELIANSLESLKNRHIVTLQNVMEGEVDEKLKTEIQEDLKNINCLLQAARLTGVCTRQMLDYILSHGEIWSSKIFHRGVMNLLSEDEVRYLDSRQILVIADKSEGNQHDDRIFLDLDKSKVLFSKWMTQNPRVRLIIMPGYICCNSMGQTATLGRNGSDYSASLLAALLHAEFLAIWTDVNGILTCDPNKVLSAETIPYVTYREAAEVAYFGSKVLHPFSLHPCIQAQIPIFVKNTFNPTHKGTVVSSKPRESAGSTYSSEQNGSLNAMNSTKRLSYEICRNSTDDKSPCRAVTLIEEIALINVEGTMFLGVCGIAQRVFGALESYRCSVILIAQCSSEHSICFAVNLENADLASEAVKKAFTSEITTGLINVGAEKDCAIISVVGDGMCGYVGILGVLATLLGENGINIKALAQGSSECNVTFVVDASMAMKALDVLHTNVIS